MTHSLLLSAITWLPVIRGEVTLEGPLVAAIPDCLPAGTVRPFSRRGRPLHHPTIALDPARRVSHPRGMIAK
jgi:hypothetical protein